MQIHPTAIVDPGAELAEDVKIGPYVIINKDVSIGAGTEIMAHAHIDSYTKIGRGCTVYPSASLGTAPQDVTYAGENTELIIGHNVTIREFVTVNRGTLKGGGVTRVGDGCYLMTYAHVGHDCQIGRNVTLVNNLAMAGHVIVEDEAILSGLVAVHQHVRIGTHAYIGGVSRVTKDVPPYMLGQGVTDFKLYGPNTIGLKRKGFPRETIAALRGAFHLVFRTNRLLAETLEDALIKFPDVPEVKNMVEFIKSSKRGVTR
ncbi:MAG: acyl-ACP--UDP-N-acetylglucosamine O-acyltransferase [Deltaproteobacteria bacterium]|nr:acyl-ACP--UDP-N-acetylglucosamine O-acyltransferase [Deltaproteobacteria bacterium]MBW2052751.1 acyl-ACP--UDP-N-acetylglucosamine O-acyltransferase [Deltaproteobacteria bacterium]MBW2139806.1 acyl-ACP--UDP-N-acetylglucosamine O-acyltransferase [Deltaproteobacteria bacterium]MBW2322710.1 acyl-ACP--UDP-N-acetylglucosamine O-acyltransferase [Deltaproteobacteria bacterium]